MRQLEDLLLSIKRPLFITGFILMSILIMILSILLVHLIGSEIPEKDSKTITIRFVILAVIITPLIETFIFQKIPIDYLEKKVESRWILLCISAIPFGLSHYIQEFLLRDIFYAFCLGATLAFAYIVAKKREDMNAYYAVVLAHAGYNLFAILIHWMLY